MSSRKIINAIILAAPGGGKGTISKKLIKDFPIKPVSFGDLLRDNVQKKTELGTQVEEIMKKGQLVPDSIIFQLLNNLQTESKESILLDGFPRTLKQATESASSFSIDAVAVLDIPKQTIIERLSDRWLHPPSGRTYAYSYNPPKIYGKDDVTGDELVQRDDDKPEIIAKRLDLYDQESEPIIDFYTGKDEVKVRRFAGTESDVIYPEVKKFFESEVFV